MTKRRCSINQYVWGFDYIDELAAGYTLTTGPWYVLQDAGHNIVAVVSNGGSLEQQYSYHPYGERLAVERIYGGIQVTALLPEQWELGLVVKLPFGFQTLFDDTQWRVPR